MNPQFGHITELFEPKVAKNLRNRKGKDAETSLDLAQQATEAGDYEAAMAHLRRAIEQGAGLSARLDLAGLLATTDDEIEAATHYTRILAESEPESAFWKEATLGMAEIETRRGDRDAALIRLRVARERHPSDVVLATRYADALMSAHRYQDARDVFQVVIELTPDVVYPYVRCAEALMSASAWEEALRSYRSALDLSPGEVELYLSASQAGWNAGLRDDALKSAEVALQLDPTDEAVGEIVRRLRERMGHDAPPADDLDSYDRDRVKRYFERLIAFPESPARSLPS